jgi:hypothetical protein
MDDQTDPRAPTTAAAHKFQSSPTNVTDRTSSAYNRVVLRCRLSGLSRKPKIGLCLSGQLRGYQTALQSWKQRLFAFGKFFIHSWSLMLAAPISTLPRTTTV